MQQPADKWRQRLSDPLLFVGYRWLSWALAGIALTLPGRPVASLPRDAGLLLLLLVVTFVLTTSAAGYIRLMRRRPLLLGLDLIAGLAAVALSGGGALPFLPYALGALVLPALLFGWRGALAAGLAAGLLELAMLAADPTLPLLVGRGLGPLLFALGWAAVAALRRPGRPASAAAAGAARRAGPGGPPAALGLRPGPTPIGREALRETAWGPPPAAASRRPADRPQAVSEPLPRPELATAIEQLVAAEGQRGDLRLSYQIAGAPQRLPAAQQSLLLRVAQEAIANVRRHARAGSCQISLRYSAGLVTLVVQDDGVGLLDGTYERPQLHALRALRYRLAELEGQLTVLESESGGVTLSASLPIDS